MSERRTHRLGAMAGLAASLALIAGPSMPAAASSGTIGGHFFGQSWASDANAKAGDLSVRLGRSAYAPCPCLGTGGVTKSNTITDIDLPGLAHLDVTKSSANADKSNHHTAQVRMIAKVTGLDLLDGLITADAIKAVSTTHATSGSITRSASGSTFVKLRIAGKGISASTGPNRKVSLPGVGYVMLREQHLTGSSNRRRGLDVTMLRVHVSVKNHFHLPVGAEIRVASVRSAYDRDPVKVAFKGGAYGAASTTDAGPWSNRIGKAAVIFLPCESTKGAWRTNTVDHVKVGNLLQLGTVLSRAKSDITGGVGTAVTRSEIQTVRLGLAPTPLVRLTALKGVAKATWDRNTNHGSWSTGGSLLADLDIAGIIALPVVVPANTHVDVPGLGHLTLYERSASVTSTAATVKVAMLHLVVTANALGIPVGTDVKVGVATATALRP